jgi:putative DNA methylase
MNNGTPRPAQTSKGSETVPRAIESGFPIVEINRLAEPERNSFKPIYQMHKWFARRASCVFRAILLGALKPAFKVDGTPTDLMEEFYRNHGHDPDTQGKVVLDPFMGGGTTVVEALRLGCKVIGIDLNPVAWFIVKTEVEPVDIEALKAAFERLAGRPVAWNDDKPLRQTLLDLYKTEVLPALEADVIYTFWVKHAICTDPNCRKEVPLFRDYLVAAKTLSIKYHRDVLCPACKKPFDWEVEVASLIADPSFMVSSPRGAAGEGRPTAAWTYTPEPPRPKGKRETTPVTLSCPHCAKHVRVNVPWDQKKHRKKVPLTVLLCPACEAVWQWRGPLPEGEVTCPGCRHSYDPHRGNVPAKGYFQCLCGNKDRIIESIRLLPQDRRLPVRPYALQAYLAEEPEEPIESGWQQAVLFEDIPVQQALPFTRRRRSEALLLPRNGKFFKRWSASDEARLQQAEMLWEKHKTSLPYPKSTIPRGAETARLLEHHYNRWHEMFAPRQLLAVSTLLAGIMAEQEEKPREMLLCAFSNTLEGNNMFVRNIPSRNTPGGTAPAGIFARHDYQPKITICEQNVWGTESGNNTFISRMEILESGLEHRAAWPDGANGRALDPVPVFTETTLVAGSSAKADIPRPDVVVTDPPYVGNVNYAELADFFYVWLRLALKDRYQSFAPEYTPKGEEIVENRERGKSREDFYSGLTEVFQHIRDTLPQNGVLAFTFHHTDHEGTVWEGLLQALCDTGFEIVAIYPVHAEREASLHLMDKENVSYDLIHLCRKRQEDPTPRSWAGIRQEVRRRARAELYAIEAGRYGNKPLPEPDVRLICIGKCLELYSAHYDRVLDHEGKIYPLHKALADISSIVDQLVTRERPLPPELEEVDSLTYAWLRLLAEHRREVNMDKTNKGTRAVRVSTEDLKKAGLIIRGRTGRGRTYEVKQPNERLEAVLGKLRKGRLPAAQGVLFDETSLPNGQKVPLVDLLHALIALADASESVLPWLERFGTRRTEILAGLRFVRDLRSDWAAAIDRVVAVIEGAPLLRQAGVI